MATIYVGTTSAGAANGTSWANRYGSLNAAEDKPVQAGDTVIVGPGVYRELLTCDVSGTAGNPITYVGDVTGAATDGVGGVVRVTGSDNDQTSARATQITASGKSYRTFRGFQFDGNSGNAAVMGGPCSDWIFEDCTWLLHLANGMGPQTTTATALTFRRCTFVASPGIARYGLWFYHGTAVDSANHLIENCLFMGCSFGVYADKVGDFTVKNCTFLLGGTAVRAGGQNSGHPVTVNNCIMFGHSSNTLVGGATGDIVEDYNSISGVQTARTNTATGANSNTYFHLPALPLLNNGQILPPPAWGTLSEWSQVKRIAGTGEASDDLFGRTRPATSSKKSWGAVQYQQPIRETTTTDASSAASLKLDDAGRVQFRVPVTATSTTISVKAYREADYAGTAPQMVIKQPGQADRTTTDAGAASTWNTLTDTFTPAAAPPYVVVELVSLNSATSGNFDVFFDTLSVS